MGSNAKRYAAKLLFQFRVVVDGESSKLRTCEERIVVFSAASAKAALGVARRKGNAGQFRYLNSDQNPVHFEFVGVMDLICLMTSARDEVWYDIRHHLRPKERKRHFIRSDAVLIRRAR
jgi:hypothetical protein